ncbi:MAG: tetratricopeptide repeat protein, partial [Paludibacteraceae bacterium]|nr:tetratricopeptide repeat protein [Paludibacteraceae bacterium]
MTNKLLATTIVTLFSLPSFASNPEDEFIRKGNDKYEAKDFKGAEDEYRKALDKNVGSKIANYNMGNTYYRRDEYDSALENYKQAISEKNSDKENAAIMHNIGNTY